MNKIWIFSTLENDIEKKAVIQLVKKCSQKHSVQLEIVCFCPEFSQKNDVWNQLYLSGVNKVYWSKDTRLQKPYYMQIVLQLKKLILENSVNVLLFHSSESNKVISAQLQTELNVGLTADCSDFIIQDDMSLIMIRPTYEGQKYAHIISKSKLQMASVLFQNGEYKTEKVKADRIGRNLEFCEVENQCSLANDIQVLNNIDRRREKKMKDVILCGGLGLGKKQNYLMLKELSELLGGSVAATRPLVENGWAERSELVGLSGITVTPKLYIAFGVSGSIQHMEGVKSSMIISINTDKEAPIHKYSKYIILSDAADMISSLKKCIRNT